MIKSARERAGLNQRQLGQRVGYGEEQISSIERGRRTPQPEFLVTVDGVLECGGLLAVLADDVALAKARRRVRHPEWFRDYADLEAKAVEVCFYSTLIVPGLFQTERYARTVFTARRPLLDEDTIEQRVAARLARQQILTRWPPPTVTAVIEESVLRRGIGGRQIQHEQLEHLLELSHLRNVEIQVLPLDCESHAGMDGPFILLTPHGKQQVGYSEVQGFNRLVTAPEEVRMLAARHGSIRGQALSPSGSRTLVENLLGES
ncbi:helix-turn-helix transcriptional regulator [Streptomyces sp. NPDC048057]|uniref:helix-turn-helix domain-containing protein n=1 Tax=Streptomyces sp. NPDC048057 TaxID=3155628 RepID=UPI0033CCF85C